MPFALRLEALLVEADLSTAVAQLLTISILLAVAGGTLGMALAGGTAVIILTLIGAALPVLFALIARNRRANKISEQLPDALDMMARAMRAGHGVANSFQFVASEMPEPINLEFGRAYEEQRLGRSLDAAVLEMTRRVPKNRDLKILAVSILVQKETGGNLTEILEKIANTIRDRYRFFGKLRSLTAEGRMSGMVLGSLPLLMLGFLALFNPKYVTPLFTDPMGWLFLGFAAVIWTVGLVWMFSLTKVDY
jgi:tight adherence protein B